MATPSPHSPSSEPRPQRRHTQKLLRKSCVQPHPRGPDLIVSGGPKRSFFKAPLVILMCSQGAGVWSLIPGCRHQGDTERGTSCAEPSSRPGGRGPGLRGPRPPCRTHSSAAGFLAARQAPSQNTGDTGVRQVLRCGGLGEIQEKNGWTYLRSLEHETYEAKAKN